MVEGVGPDQAAAEPGLSIFVVGCYLATVVSEVVVVGHVVVGESGVEVRIVYMQLAILVR